MPQCGRGADGASAASTASIARSTASGARVLVKWIATVSRPYWGLSQRRSPAIVRISETCSAGAIRAPIARTASIAAPASWRATTYSDWIS